MQELGIGLSVNQIRYYVLLAEAPGKKYFLNKTKKRLVGGKYLSKNITIQFCTSQKIFHAAKMC